MKFYPGDHYWDSFKIGDRVPFKINETAGDFDFADGVYFGESDDEFWWVVVKDKRLAAVVLQDRPPAKELVAAEPISPERIQELNRELIENLTNRDALFDIREATLPEEEEPTPWELQYRRLLDEWTVPDLRTWQPPREWWSEEAWEKKRRWDLEMELRAAIREKLYPDPASRMIRSRIREKGFLRSILGPDRQYLELGELKAKRLTDLDYLFLLGHRRPEGNKNEVEILFSDDHSEQLLALLGRDEKGKLRIPDWVILEVEHNLFRGERTYSRVEMGDE